LCWWFVMAAHRCNAICTIDVIGSDDWWACMWGSYGVRRVVSDYMLEPQQKKLGHHGRVWFLGLHKSERVRAFIVRCM
jgi:hypothetical protein